MAEEIQYASRVENKRKYEEHTIPPPPSAPRRPTGFSAPIVSSSPDSTQALPPPPPASYNNVPPLIDEIQIAKQRAQEIAARLFSSAEAKRPRVENGGSAADDLNDKGFSSASADLGLKPLVSNSQMGMAPSSAIPVAYGFQGSSKKIEIPNGRVGVIIGKGGETIKNLQLQSGAKIQVTRDMDADPNSQSRMVELMGTQEQISKAEQLISEVLGEAELGGSGVVSRRLVGQPGAEQFVMKVANNKVGLIIGKGGETIKNMQARTGARIQLIPLHLPPGDTSTERTVHIDGTKEQIEAAKQLVNEVTSEAIIDMAMISKSINRVRNPSAGGYSQQGYRPTQPPSWGPPGQPQMQQPGYGYMQPGAYPGQLPQYGMSQPPYTGYPSQPTSGWDQTAIQPNHQTTQGGGYDYYNQQLSSQQQPQGGSSAPADNSGYNYGQQPASGYNTQGSYGESNYGQQPPAGQQQGYSQDGQTGGYQAPAPQPGYGQPQSNLQSGYDQQQGYNSATTYGAVANPAQDGTPSYGSQGGAAQVTPGQQVPPVQPPAAGQQGYASQQPSPTPPGYGMPPNSQPGYGSQAPAGYGQMTPYGPPQAQKPPNQPAYGQTQQPPSTQGSYLQPAPVQPGYSHSQQPTDQPSYAQTDSTHHRAPSSGYGSAAAPQQTYGQQPYSGPPGYGQQQQQQPYAEAYAGGYSQPLVYSADNSAGGAYDAAAPASQALHSGGVKASPPS